MKTYLFIPAVMAVACVAAGCSSGRVTQQQVRKVRTDTVHLDTGRRTVSLPGRIRPSSDVDLGFRVAGTIERIDVEPGAFVRRGQVLARLDRRDYATQLQATEARYRQIKADAERVIGLYEKGSVTPSDYEKAVYGLQQIEAQYEAHKNALADTELRAPFDGYVQRRMFDRGETVGAGMPVVSMIGSGMPEIEISLPASLFLERDNFSTFSCTADPFPGREFGLEPVGINRKANMNQLYTMRLRFKSDPGIGVPPAGMSAMVTITYAPSEDSRVRLPLTALLGREGGSCVWVYDPATGSVASREVVVEEILSDGDMIVADGLADGDIVVTAGVHSLEEGQRVALLAPVADTNVGGML